VPRYRPRRVSLRDGREVTLRAIAKTDATKIVQAFERLSAVSRYYRFMRYKNKLDDAALERGVHPQPGREFAFVAMIPAAHGIDIVGAGQYVRASEGDDRTCEFVITVAEDWRGNGLATRLLSSLMRRARLDGYETMGGVVPFSELEALERKVPSLQRQFSPDLVSRSADSFAKSAELGED
jgi:GNAT superfamily N-acetyltransferase